MIEKLVLAAIALSSFSAYAADATHVSDPADGKRLAQGNVLYMKHCAACHGHRAQGADNWERPTPEGHYPPPPLDGSGHTWHHSKAELVYIIKYGKSTMWPFEELLSDSEIGSIIDWFQSLWPKPIFEAWQRDHKAGAHRQH